MSTRKALALSFPDRYSGLVIHTASSMLIAQLLTFLSNGISLMTKALHEFIAVSFGQGLGRAVVKNNAASVILKFRRFNRLTAASSA